MSDLITNAAQIAGIVLVALLLSSALTSALYRPVRRFVCGYAPATRSAATLSYALITPGIALIAVLANLSPVGMPLIFFEHCHQNQCGTHAPLLAAGSFGTVSLMAGAAVLGVALAVSALKLFIVGRRQLLTLLKLADHQRSYAVIDSDHVLAWCCGILRPRIVMSRGLLQTLSPPQISIVLAHEQAHAMRLDNLRNIIARWSTSAWPPSLRRQLCEDLHSDNEACCDAVALRAGPAVFREVVDLVSTPTSQSITHQHVGFGTTQADVRIKAATSSQSRYPGLAYLLVSFVWTLQAVLVSAATHPLLEAIATTGA